MKTFNINHYIYIQITDKGWAYLKNTVGQEYIDACIDKEHYRKTIDGQTWYKLQAHQVFELMPMLGNNEILYGTNIMIEEKDLT